MAQNNSKWSKSGKAEIFNNCREKCNPTRTATIINTSNTALFIDLKE